MASAGAYPGEGSVKALESSAARRGQGVPQVSPGCPSGVSPCSPGRARSAALRGRCEGATVPPEGARGRRRQHGRGGRDPRGTPKNPRRDPERHQTWSRANPQTPPGTPPSALSANGLAGGRAPSPVAKRRDGERSLPLAPRAGTDGRTCGE